MCSSVSTVFITVPASPTVETIYALSEGSAATLGIEASNNGAAQPTSTLITKTLTASMVSMQVVSVIHASSRSENQAAYSFTEDNGTTTWLGATPPALASLKTSTQVISLEPVPTGYVAPPAEVTPITSYLTVSPTKTRTETYVATQTLAVLTAPASAGAYTGLASNGWNSSMSTLITVKSPGVGSVTIAEELVQYSITAYPMIPSGLVPFPRGNAARQKKVRDVENIISATIDGVVVSWTDSYDGVPLSSSNTSSSVVPVTATTSQFEPQSCKCPKSEPRHRLTHYQAIFSLPSSPVQTQSSSSTVPMNAIGVSTSNALPSLSPTSTSSSSAVQKTSDTFSSLSQTDTLAALSTAATATVPSCSDAPAKFVIDFDDLPASSAGPEVCTSWSHCLLFSGPSSSWNATFLAVSWLETWFRRC